MNQPLQPAVILIASLVAAAGIGLGVALHKPPASAPPQSASAFAEASVRAIAGSWDPAAMLKRAAPDILTPFVREELPHAYARLAHSLGALESLQPPVARSGQDGSAMPRDGAVAEYAMNARFASGPARVQIVVRRHGDGWQVLGLHVDSPALQH